MALLIGFATLVSTLLGGLFALKSKDKLHLILGFSAGAVIAVAFFDLLPEALDLGTTHYTISTVTSLVVVGFVVFMIVDRLLTLHMHSHEEQGDVHGATALSLHSFLDGVGIGLAFKVSAVVGTAVAIGVLVHDFSDGINTVNFILKSKGTDRRAFRWLILDAIAPVLGVVSTYFFTLSEPVLGLVLALFCGFFLYIGASDLLPESHHRHPTFVTTLMTILGIAVLYFAIHLANV